MAMSYENDRICDLYSVTFESGAEEEARLTSEVEDMEADSRWVPDIDSNDLRLTAIDGPMFGIDSADTYGLDPEVAADTASGLGTKLIIHLCLNGVPVKSSCVRSTARNALMETAKMWGTAFNRMSVEKVAETLNNGLEVARGKSLILIRGGKVSALHSDGTYCQMPISSLIKTTKAEVSARLGKMEFMGGVNQHGFTSALWCLPDAKEKLMKQYRTALSKAVTAPVEDIDFMPAVKFLSSDTASSAARLIPLFIMNNKTAIQLCDGICIRHEFRRNDLNGVSLFREEARDIFARFTDAMEKAAELSEIDIVHPTNCVVSLCKKYVIPRKYGEAARVQVEAYSMNADGTEEPMSAYDIYLFMCSVVTEATLCGASVMYVNTLSDTIAKILNADWREHDVGGTINW